MSVRFFIGFAAILSNGLVTPVAALTSAQDKIAAPIRTPNQFEAMESFANHVREVMFSADPERIANLLHPSFSVWQNTDGYAFSGATIDRFHQHMKKNLKSIEFLDRVITPTADGYIDQHVKQMVTMDGRLYRIPCVIIVSVLDGRLIGAREYMDSAHLPPIIAELRDAHATKPKVGSARQH